MSEEYTEKEYLSIDEAATYIGWNRATLYAWINDLGIKTLKFRRNRKKYLAIGDVQRLKEIKEKPWTAGTDEEEVDDVA